MGFTEILTIIFVLLKAFKVITWSWWLVFAPEIVALVIYAVLTIYGFYITAKTGKEIKHHVYKF